MMLMCAFSPVITRGASTEVLILPAVYRVEVDNYGNTRNDQARLGKDSSSSTVYRRTWAEFDISALKGKVVTDVGFRVYNEWSGSEINALRYSALRPSSAPSALTGQHTFANKYNGFIWPINFDNAWTPDENDFFRPGVDNWETWKRKNDGVNYKSILEDLQAHIDDYGTDWFALGFDCYNCTTRVNLRLSDDYFDPESIFMEVTTSGDIADKFSLESNFGGRNAEGADQDIAPLTCGPINFATGNKYRQDTDLLLSGPGLVPGS